jgi:AraC-like DNA-binding protein
MASVTSDFRSFHFSRVPVREGDFPTEVMRAFRPFGFARRILSLLSDGLCYTDITMQAVGRSGGKPGDFGVCVQRSSVTGGVSAQRTPDLLCNDDVVLHIQETGRRTISQLGRQAIIGAGSALLSSNSDVSTIVLPTPARFVTIGVPRKLMLALAPGLEDAFVRPLPSNPSILRLLLNYANVLEDEDTQWTPELQHAVAAHIHDLCALAIGATRDAAEIAMGRGLRAARLRAIKADIVRNLRDGDVSIAALAVRHRVTARYIQRLFESEGTTLSRYVLGQRLVQVHRMLVNPHLAHRAISTIAYDAGFTDLSTFNREFRRLFGATPSDVRAAMRD